MMVDNPKGYWIGFGIGFVIAFIICGLTNAAFGNDFWRGVVISLVIIFIGSEIGANFVGAKSKRD